MTENEELIATNTAQNYLWVEGSDDKHICIHLIQYHNIPEQTIKIVDKEGIEKLLKGLEVQLTVNKKARLGIIVDADMNLSARWQSLRNVLSRVGYKVPARPEPYGTILRKEGRPTVGLWLMPDNVNSGMVEDFFRFLVPLDDSLWPLAEETIKRVIAIDRRFPEAQTGKALTHTWLAWQEDPRTFMGQAITNQYVNANAPQAQQLIHWMRQLFDIPPAK